jgi:gluconolactonase
MGGSAGPSTPEGICPATPGTPPSGQLSATLVQEVDLPDYDYHLFEGPAWLGDTLYFSDIKPSPWNSTIRAFVPATRTVTDFLVNAASNGLAVSGDGVLYSATAGKQEISRYTIDPPGQQTAVAGPFNSPNDLTIASDGTIYFSDPQQGELPAGNLPQFLHVVKGGVDAIFSEDIMDPNGVVLSPDEDILYVTGGGYTGYLKKVTLVDGLAGDIVDLATDLQVPDGVGKDCAGNIYVALHEMQQIGVFDPSGTEIATIALGAAANGQTANPTNLAFGGADRMTLFITAAYSLWEVPLSIAGYPN